MRIIAGEARGLRLQTPAGPAIRPTTDRVKEALFNTLGDLTGKTVVDLFAGSGSLGAEAISRGAAEVVAIESDRKHAALVARNYRHVCQHLAQPPKTQVLTADATRAPLLLARLHPDIVLTDAPYFDQADPVAKLAANCEFRNWLDGAIWAIEHSRHNRLTLPKNSPWRLLREKAYGEILLTFLRPS